MVSVPLQEKAALARRTGRIKPGDGRALRAEHAMLVVYGEPAFVVHEHGAHRAKRDERRLGERLAKVTAY